MNKDLTESARAAGFLTFCVFVTVTGIRVLAWVIGLSF